MNDCAFPYSKFETLRTDNSRYGIKGLKMYNLNFLRKQNYNCTKYVITLAKIINSKHIQMFVALQV